MRLSTRGRYGLAAMIYLGKKYGDNPVSLNAVSYTHLTLPTTERV